MGSNQIKKEKAIKAYEIQGDFTVEKTGNDKVDRNTYNNSVASGYAEMAKINLEEAKASENTYDEGLIKWSV